MKRIISALILMMTAYSANLFAAECKYSLTADFAYYPKSDFVSGKIHFAPVTAPFQAIEFRTTGNASYKIPTPFDSHWLVQDANILLNGAVELTPITIIPKVSVEFTPVPFLVFSAGASMGFGWNMMGFMGIAELKDDKFPDLMTNRMIGEYSNLNSMEHAYYDFWGKGIFQFDTGAIWQGNWTHVLLLAGYQLIYKGITGIPDGRLWTWQTFPNQTNGLQYMANGILAYQMPLKIHRIGIMGDISSHFRDSDFGDYSKHGYDGTFKFANIAPFVQIDFNEANTLYILATFATRPSFMEEHDDYDEEPYLKSSGTEWYFRRVALSWTHYFN